MNVVWSKRARLNLNSVARYISRQFGRLSLDKFRKEINRQTKLLSTTPNIGSLEPMLENRQRTYRYLVINGLSKLVYCIEGGEYVLIADFWDCRREPKNLIEGL